MNWLTRLWLPIGKRVVIIGGLIYGCEAAEFLVKRGRRVTIVEESDELGTKILEIHRPKLLAWLARQGTTMLTGVKYDEITDKGLVIGGVDMAGVSRLQYPTNARLIRVMCSARVPIRLVERAFEKGAAGVLVAGCEFPTCHYITGNYACEMRMKRAKKVISKKGYDPEKLWNIWCSAADGPKFANTMREMVKKLGI